MALGFHPRRRGGHLPLQTHESLPFQGADSRRSPGTQLGPDRPHQAGAPVAEERQNLFLTVVQGVLLKRIGNRGNTNPGADHAPPGQRGPEHFPQRGKIVVRDPAGEFEHGGVEHRLIIGNILHIPHLALRDIAGIIRDPHDEPGEHPRPEGHERPTAHLGQRLQFRRHAINKRLVQRQRKRDGNIERHKEESGRQKSGDRIQDAQPHCL
jgi:hypothetical protein